ncbi:YibE/F family protein [Patescibacteria group bacterium]|nr:YibE/F family protein [Patescibacteria group bacterium]
MNKIIKIIFIVFILLQIFSANSKAQEQSEAKTYQATITEILEKNNSTNLNAGEMFQKLELVVTSKGELKSEKISLENIDPRIEYKVGDKLMIYRANAETFLIADQVRTNALLVLFLVFVFFVLLISKWRGLGSLLGMSFSFLVIIYFILPKIAAGGDPILIAILGSLLIIPATFYPSHGMNRKTTIAVFSTLIALVVTGFLASFFINFAKLSGLSSEEAGFLQTINPGLFNMKGLLLAGIIIGVLGVLDDVTVSQASIVEQLKIADPNLKTAELYKKAMQVGHDHISSMVNTLVLVYAGASLPLLLLFNDAAKPFSEIVNYEIIADEIVRTLVGSIGLILAVPISTFLSAILIGKSDNKMSHDHLV